jgi:TM2 domain-containing membrane protein YozV
MKGSIMEKSEKGFVATLLLCFFLGAFGVHRFFVGKIGTGILMLITFGGLGIWTLIDFVMIACGKFKDNQGLPIKN